MKYFKTVLILIIITLLTGCSYKEYNISSYEYSPKTKSEVYSSDNQLIGELYNEKRSYVELDKIPEDLKKAIVAVEDSRFYKHNGFDLIRIVKAIFVDIKEGELKEGASTITQQLAKNLFLTNEKSFTRKFKELIYSIQLERKYSKDQILEMYLNEIYLGQRVYGVQEASMRYFGKSVEDLSLAESAFIAGLPQAPSAYDPTKHFDRAKKRQEIVLNRMVATEDITQEQLDKAKEEEIIIVKKKDEKFKGKYKKENEHFMNRVVNKLVEHFSKEFKNKKNLAQEEIRQEALYKIENGGYKIYTTLNGSIQDQAVLAIKSGMDKNALGNQANGSVVSIDPNTGGVIAYYGGLRSIDMAMKTRQPGSTIKPLYFAGAINEGIIDSNTLILDEATDFNGYEPKNYGEKYMGYVTSREALVYSLNNASVKVMNALGVEKALNYLEDFGVSSIDKKDDNLATALGGMTYGITPLELANAYGVIANEGVYKEAYFIERVEDSQGNIIFNKGEQNLETKEVFTRDTALQLKETLYDVVNRGIAKNARLPYYTGGKTGTTNDKKDLWFAGFIDNLATSIWIGNEENIQLNGNSGIPARIYGNYMKDIINKNLISRESLKRVAKYDDTVTISILLPGLEKESLSEITEDEITDIVIPESEIPHFQNRLVERVSIDQKSGKIYVEGKCPVENKIEKIYLYEQAPKEECDLPHILNRLENFYYNMWDSDKNINRKGSIKNKTAA